MKYIIYIFILMTLALSSIEAADVGDILLQTNSVGVPAEYLEISGIIGGKVSDSKTVVLTHRKVLFGETPSGRSSTYGTSNSFELKELQSVSLKFMTYASNRGHRYSVYKIEIDKISSTSVEVKITRLR